MKYRRFSLTRLGQDLLDYIERKDIQESSEVAVELESRR